MGIKNRIKEASVLVVSLSMVLSLTLSTSLRGEDSNITNTTTSTVTSTNTNTNNNTNNNTISSTSVATNNNNNVNNTTINQTTTATNNNTNVNTSTSNVTSNITQTQDVTNTSTVTSVGTNTNINNSTSSNNNQNTNLNTNTSNSTSSVSTENVNQNTNQNTNLNTNNNNSTSVSRNDSTQKVTQRIKTAPPSAIAPSIMSYSQDLCTTGASSAVQTQFFGVSTGRSVRDDNCERLKLSKGLYDMGMKVAAVAMLCADKRVHVAMNMAGTPCPYKGKIGAEAQKAWLENPEDRPDWDDIKKEISSHEFKAYKKKDFCKKYPTHKICLD
tara:strand:- start:158 stop:1141 length:984 start_codon:yes stop_codon:yes gene_type:complete